MKQILKTVLAKYSDMIAEATQMVGETDPLVERLKSHKIEIEDILTKDNLDFNKTSREYRRFLHSI